MSRKPAGVSPAGLILGLSLLLLLAGCRSAAPRASLEEAVPKPVPQGPLCEAKGPALERLSSEEGWSFCVQQQADCRLETAAEAVRLRWCEQSPSQSCVDKGCKQYKDGTCWFGVHAPPGAEVRAVPPRNPSCGARWECRVRSRGPDVFRCAGRCVGPEEPSPQAQRPGVTLAEGDYAVVAVWEDSICAKGRMRLGPYGGQAFTMTAKGKCLPADLNLRAVFGAGGGAFFAVGEAPAGSDRFYFTGVVEDPDAFTGVLTRTSGEDEKELERLHLTGRRMTDQ